MAFFGFSTAPPKKKIPSLLTLLVCPTTIHAPQKLCSTIASTIYSNYGKKNIVLNSNLQVIEATHGGKKHGDFTGAVLQLYHLWGTPVNTPRPRPQAQLFLAAHHSQPGCKSPEAQRWIKSHSQLAHLRAGENWRPKIGRLFVCLNHLL